MVSELLLYVCGKTSSSSVGIYLSPDLDIGASFTRQSHVTIVLRRPECHHSLTASMEERLLQCTPNRACELVSRPTVKIESFTANRQAAAGEMKVKFANLHLICLQLARDCHKCRISKRVAPPSIYEWTRRKREEEEAEVKVKVLEQFYEFSPRVEIVLQSVD